MASSSKKEHRREAVWLDPRCPFCADVETGLGPALKEQADAGTYRVANC